MVIYTDASFNDGKGGIAWYCPTEPELNGGHTCHLLNEDSRQVELLAIWGALTSMLDRHLQQDSIRILTDAKEALEEIGNINTDDGTAQTIRKRVHDLQELGLDLRI